MWVRWIHAYKLKTRSFWDVHLGSNVSWGWRKLLTIRSIIRPFIWFELGNGCKASAWFDMWDTNGPVMSHIMNRAISSAGFTTRDNVANVVHGTDWKWPQSWFMRFPSLSNFIVHVLQENKEDNLLWKASDGLFNEFSVIWSIVGKAVEMPSISPIWNDIISWLLPLSLKDNVSSIVRRLILASSVYFIWQERNNRIHSKPSRNEDQVAKIIVEMVRLKLTSINFKNKESVRLMKVIWKIA
ncbi:hypothetical protein Tco_1446428 [Tanacetum coccineum]